jgi:hypothetical protein
MIHSNHGPDPLPENKAGNEGMDGWLCDRRHGCLTVGERRRGTGTTGLLLNPAGMPCYSGPVVIVVCGWRCKRLVTESSDPLCCTHLAVCPAGKNKAERIRGCAFGCLDLSPNTHLPRSSVLGSLISD